MPRAAIATPPIVPLLEWQEQWIEDDARFKLLVATTQGGKSFGTSLGFSLDRMKKNSAPLGILLSASERQSNELMEKVRMHTSAWKVAFDSRSEVFEGIEVMQHTALFPNGKRLIALPANPATARGYSGDVFLDEFALHKDAKSIWAALFGRITRGYKLSVASTIHGTNNKFYELVKMLGMHEGVRPGKQPVRREGWSGHWVDIFMCREQGLQVDIEGIREALGDESIFLEEYCNVPQEDALDWIPLALVLTCETDEAETKFDYEPIPDTFAGWDFARKRDGSVIWILRKRGKLMTAGLIYLDKMTFKVQEEAGRRVAKCVTRMLIDQGGPGAQVAETLTGEFPGVVEGVDFTNARKQTMSTKLKETMEEVGVGIPADKKVQRAFQAVKRFTSPVGNVLFDAARTKDGHADEYWALALALQAALEGEGHVPATDPGVGMVGKPELSGLLGRRF